MSTHHRFCLAMLARMVVVMVLAVFAWPTFSAACCIGIETAAAQLTGADDGCCPASAGNDDDGDGDDSKGEHNGACSCPLSCASGCTGLGRAVVVTPACRVAPAGSAPLVRQHQAASDPPAPDPHDILHVPKHVAA